MLKILNFRTLAKDALNREGKKIKPNTIFRSGVLTYAAKTDIRRLKSYGIRDIYDLRNQEELSRMPALDDSHFNTHHFDILEEAAHADASVYLDMTREEMNNGIINLYHDELGTTDRYADAVGAIIRQENPEFLFHCTAGKDRTGIFGAILMMMLDFDAESIKKEYITIDKRSMRLLGRQMLKKVGVNPKDVDISKFEGVMGVMPEFIDAYFKKILNDYESFDLYLNEKAGVTPETKAEFKKRYLV